jgi:hypothetical protein
MLGSLAHEVMSACTYTCVQLLWSMRLHTTHEYDVNIILCSYAVAHKHIGVNANADRPGSLMFRRSLGASDFPSTLTKHSGNLRSLPTLFSCDIIRECSTRAHTRVSSLDTIHARACRCLLAWHQLGITP